MKQKDIVYLLLAVVIFLAAGYVAYTQLVPHKASSQGVEVEVVGVIPEAMDETGMSQLSDPAKVRDFGAAPDLSALGNASLFGN